MKERIAYYQNHPTELERIQKNSYEFTLKNYSQKAVARRLGEALSKLHK